MDISEEILVAGALMLRQKALPAKGHFALWTSVLRKSYVDDALAIFGGAKLGVGVVYSLVPKLSSPIFLRSSGGSDWKKSPFLSIGSGEPSEGQTSFSIKLILYEKV